MQMKNMISSGKKVVRAPLYNIDEVAAHFGLTTKALDHRIHRSGKTFIDEVDLKGPGTLYKSGLKSHKRYYNRAAAIAWVVENLGLIDPKAKKENKCSNAQLVE